MKNFLTGIGFVLLFVTGESQAQSALPQQHLHGPKISVTEEVFLRYPDSNAFFQTMPYAAIQSEPPIEGKATINCRVESDGHLSDCHVQNEEPHGIGFGEAALALAPLFQLDLRAIPDQNTRVEFPIQWVFPAG